jgi:putative transposase
MDIAIAYRTLNKLSDTLGDLVHPEAIFHSDQGFHHTHSKFHQRVKQIGFIQSTSRKGNCWDNAPMESFFGHFKDEVDYKQCQTFEELNQLISYYIEDYNLRRYRWDLNKMAPAQYRRPSTSCISSGPF